MDSLLRQTPSAIEVVVVIVHHRGTGLLDRCLRSLLASRAIQMQVVVVANACSEELPAVPLADRRVHVVQSTAALGFSEANNLGMRWAVEHLGVPEHVFFLNNDTEVEPWAVATLRDSLRERPGCSVAGPCLKILGAENHLNSLGLNVSRIGECWDEGIGRHLSDYGDLPGCREVLAVTGSALMMRFDALEQVGGWTEFYGYYLEDVDLCLKTRSHGWTVLNEPAAVVYHAVSATAGQDSDFKRLLTWRNQLLLLLAHWPWSLLLRVLPRLLAREALVYVKRRWRRTHDDARLQARAWIGALRYLFRALGERAACGRSRQWVQLLAAPGTVPRIVLPAVTQPESVPAGEHVESA